MVNLTIFIKRSPAMIAAIYGKPQILKILFKYGGVDFSLKDLNGLTTLALAEKYCNPPYFTKR